MIGTIVLGTVIAVALHQFCGTEKGCSCGACLGCRMAILKGQCQQEQDAARRAFDWQRYEFMLGIKKDVPKLSIEGLKRAEQSVNVYIQERGAPSPSPWP